MALNTGRMPDVILSIIMSVSLMPVNTVMILSGMPSLLSMAMSSGTVPLLIAPRARVMFAIFAMKYSG